MLSYAVGLSFLVYLSVLELRLSDRVAAGLFIYEFDRQFFVPPTVHEVKRRFFENCGIGQKLSDSWGRKTTERPKDGFYEHVFETSPYSLFDYSLHRYSRSSTRTMKPDSACIFFIPFDITHNTWMAAADKSLSRNITRRILRKRAENDLSTDIFHQLRSPEFAIARVRRVIAMLNASKYFHRSGGRDHFFIEDDSPYFRFCINSDRIYTFTNEIEFLRVSCA